MLDWFLRRLAIFWNNGQFLVKFSINTIDQYYSFFAPSFKLWMVKHLRAANVFSTIFCEWWRPMFVDYSEIFRPWTFSSPNFWKVALKNYWIKTIKRCIFRIFLKEQTGGFWKNLFFFKVGKGDKFALECISNDVFSQKHLYLFFLRLSTKQQKTFKLQIIKKLWEKFYGKKAFNFLKGIFNKNWGAENIVVVASCLF